MWRSFLAFEGKAILLELNYCPGTAVVSDGGTPKIPQQETGEDMNSNEREKIRNHGKDRRMNAGELVRYLKRENTVEETSLLGTEQDKHQGKKTASQNKAGVQEEMLRRNKVG